MLWLVSLRITENRASGSGSAKCRFFYRLRQNVCKSSPGGVCHMCKGTLHGAGFLPEYSEMKNPGGQRIENLRDIFFSEGKKLNKQRLIYPVAR